MVVTKEQVDKVREINQQYKAGELTEEQARNQAADSLYAFDPNKLKNADVNISQYGDDSSATNYNNPDLWWGENSKYTGENTKNSQVAYDPNATIEWLNPNYQYWKNAQMANSEQANYIATRNDQIASALYNAGKTSIEDVRKFLEWQRGFYNSDPNERENTINSVWKRLGQMAQENWNKDAENSNWPTDQNNDEALNNMQNDLLKDTSGKLYGKVTADEGEPTQWITTAQDPYNVERLMAEGRIANVKKLQTMDSQSIAASIIAGTPPYGEQAMRDLMQYNPQKYEEVQQSIKQLKWQKTINSITNGEYDGTGDIEIKEKTITNDNVNKAESIANDSEQVWSLLASVDEELSDNSSATTAEWTMANLKADIQKLNTRLKNLKKEASQVFKWDVPQYIVQAYIANRTAEIQDKLSELNYQYDAAYQRYQTEVDNAWKQKEYDIKLQQLAMQKQSQEFDQWYKKQTLAKSSIMTDDSWVSWQMNINSNWEIYYTQVQSIQTYNGSGMKWAWLKNNNPWNIKDTSFWNVIWVWANGFAQFATPEDGFDALVAKIQYNQTNPNSKYYGKTIREYFQLYAPSSDWNNPDAYANSVAKALWVSVDTPISQLDATEFAAQIAKHDSWYDYSTYGQFRKGTNVNWDTEVSPDWTLLPDNDWVWTAAYQIISSDWVTPIDFRQRIYNLVPATLKNSNTELENLYTIAKQLYENWMTADEAAMIFYWLDPRNDKTKLLKPLLMKARVAWDLPETFYWSLGWLLEAWETGQAVRLVENSILSDEQKTKEAEAISFVNKINRIEEYMNQFEKENWWVYQWTLSDFITKYMPSKWSTKYTQLAADIQNTFAQIQNDLLWSSMTQSEIEHYKGMLPSDKDNWAVLRTKLTSAKNNMVSDVNWVRTQVWLPQINAKQLVNPSSRVSLYLPQSDRE